MNEMNYTVHGNIDAENILICIHGGMGIDGGSLRVNGLLKIGNEALGVIIPDLSGHGKSKNIEVDRFSHELWLNDIETLVSKFKAKRVILLGHSYGGFLSLEYCCKFHERIDGQILVGTSAGPVPFNYVEQSSDNSLKQYFKKMWPLLFYGDNKYWEVFDSLTFTCKPFNHAFGYELSHYDVRENLFKITMPTLLLVGKYDHYITSMQYMAQQITDNQLYIFERSGHMPFLEQEYEFVNNVRSFIMSKGSRT